MKVSQAKKRDTKVEVKGDKVAQRVVEASKPSTSSLIRRPHTRRLFIFYLQDSKSKVMECFPNLDLSFLDGDDGDDRIELPIPEELRAFCIKLHVEGLADLPSTIPDKVITARAKDAATPLEA